MNAMIKKEEVFLREVVREDILQCKTLLLILEEKHQLNDLKKLILEICKKKRKDSSLSHLIKFFLKIFRKKGGKEQMAFSMEALYVGTSSGHFCFRLPVLKQSEIESLTFYSTEKDGNCAVGPKIFFNQQS